jgi:GcrA cell cycle regulator
MSKPKPKSKHPASTWTAERTALARKLWLDGWSCSLIAKRLGGVTRNAVIGKLSRIGCGGRNGASAPTLHAAYATSERATRCKAATAAIREGVKRARRTSDPAYRFGPQKTQPGEGKPPQHPSLDVPADTDPVPLLKRTVFRCAWPLGEPEDPEMLCCGAPATRGAYCAVHGAVAYVPLTARQRDADRGTLRLLRRAA